MPRKLVSATVIVALLVLIVAVLFVLRPRSGALAQRTPVPIVHPEGSARPDLGPSTLPVADPAAYAELHSSTTTALQDVRIVDGLLQNMKQSLKTTALPPLGFNEEITRALTGRNPLQLAFIPSTHPAINARGLLCDRWSTPYHFHPVANDRADVRSAGVDKKLFTPDDVVSNFPLPAADPVPEPDV